MVFLEGLALGGTSASLKAPLIATGVSTCVLLRATNVDLSSVPVLGSLAGRMTTLKNLMCCVEESKSVDDEELDSDSSSRGLPSFIPIAIGCIGAADLLLGGVLGYSWNLPVDVPLKAWVVGSIFLSFPASSLVYNTSKEIGFHNAFLLESFANVLSFAWLSVGMLWVSKSTAFISAPLLFWTVYILCVTTWSVIGTSILGLIVTTVVAILFGGKQPPAIS